MLASVGEVSGLRAALAARSVGVELGRSLILQDVSFSVGVGEVVALLGANGSGKSTLVKACLGILPLSSGQISVFGESLGRTTPWRRIGYVPQRMPASTGIPTTALEVVRSGALAQGHWFRAPRPQALEALDAMGMADRAAQPVQQMSGGQQQRVLIARALVRQPDLLLLDEPTSGIDLSTTGTFVETLDRLRRVGTSVVIVLHETEAFADLIDRAVVLRHGRVVYDGTPPRARRDHVRQGRVHAHPYFVGSSDPFDLPTELPR